MSNVPNRIVLQILTHLPRTRQSVTAHELLAVVQHHEPSEPGLTAEKFDHLLASLERDGFIAFAGVDASGKCLHKQQVMLGFAGARLVEGLAKS